jgi:hypothetical protein
MNNLEKEWIKIGRIIRSDKRKARKRIKETI